MKVTAENFNDYMANAKQGDRIYLIENYDIRSYTFIGLYPSKGFYAFSDSDVKKAKLFSDIRVEDTTFYTSYDEVRKPFIEYMKKQAEVVEEIYSK